MPLGCPVGRGSQKKRSADGAQDGQHYWRISSGVIVIVGSEIVGFMCRSVYGASFLHLSATSHLEIILVHTPKLKCCHFVLRTIERPHQLEVFRCHQFSSRSACRLLPGHATWQSRLAKSFSGQQLLDAKKLKHNQTPPAPGAVKADRSAPPSTPGSGSKPSKPSPEKVPRQSTDIRALPIHEVLSAWVEFSQIVSCTCTNR